MRSDFKKYAVASKGAPFGCPTIDDLGQVRIAPPQTAPSLCIWGRTAAILVQPCSRRSERRFPPPALPCFHSQLCEPLWARCLIGARSNLALNLRLTEWPGVVKSSLPRDSWGIERSPRSLSGTFFSRAAVVGFLDQMASQKTYGPPGNARTSRAQLLRTCSRKRCE